MSGTLYIVATPIGNLSDITFRAIETLKNADLICAEDTRTTSILLEKYNIKTKLTSYHKFSELEKTPVLVNEILSGKNIALVSDAGTPLVSDPGNVLVGAAIENNIKIVPVGGISALTTFVSSIKRNGEDFKFTGFLPKVQKQLEDIFLNNICENLIFYESPNRITETLKIIQKIRPCAKISVGRELTKKFEEILSFSIKDAIMYFECKQPKGEFVCMLHKEEKSHDDEIKIKIGALKKQGFSQKDTALILEITDKANKNQVKSYFNQA